jgi:acetyl/propionyl-CoA carboxylase alpha subunit
MRVVAAPADLRRRARPRSESGSSFPRLRHLLRAPVDAARHIEVQVLADHHGTVLPFVERECSICAATRR